MIRAESQVMLELVLTACGLEWLRQRVTWGSWQGKVTR